MRDQARPLTLSLLALLLVLAGCKKIEGTPNVSSTVASAAPCTCPPGDPLCDCLMKAQTKTAPSAAPSDAN